MKKIGLLSALLIVVSFLYAQPNCWKNTTNDSDNVNVYLGNIKITKD